ncbi:MAG: N5-glutamine methyltransferase family protein [Candidatus Saccharimonadales bacterium]
MNASSLLTIGDWLKSATSQLQKAGIATARLDCQVLLEDATGINRSLLLAHPERTLKTKTLQKLDKQIHRRIEHEPIAYIRHKTEFYGREFYINHQVLEPRPESESMIELVKGLSLPKKTIIADIGTGSGALSITCKLELPWAHVIATDIDRNCLVVARRNALRLKARVKFLEGDLLEPLAAIQPKTLVLLCNLPYVPDSFQINPAALREPRIAIFGGQDGLDIYRELFKHLKKYGQVPIFLLTESMPPQHSDLISIAKDNDFGLQRTEDFIQLFARLP